MALTLRLGRAPTLVIDRFNEFKSIYSSVTAALVALLERDHLLEKKYRFQQDEGDHEQWDITGTQADTEPGFQDVGDKLDSYVLYNRLDSRAAAIEELLLSPNVEMNDQNGLSEDTSSEEHHLTEMRENSMENVLDISINLEPIGLMPIEETIIKNSMEDKKKRKHRKPKKHKRKHCDPESADEEDPKKKRVGREVWRRVGSKFIGWYTCVLCDEQMRNEQEYIKHIESHGCARSPACMDCGNYFESMVAYEDHIGNYGKELIYRCEVGGCGKTFQFKCRLDCHQRTHSGEMMFKCNDCGHQLSSIRSIIRHTRAKHLNERPFRCHMCDKAFAIQSQLTRHIKDHISPPHFTCEQCGKTFSSRQGHHYHQLDHLGIKPHKCSVCGKAFRNKTDMVNHERIHSGDRPFTCELCGKSFVEKGALRKHRVVHTREKNFVCSNCGKQFGYKCSLDGHLRKCQQDVSLLTMSSVTALSVPQALTPQCNKPLAITEKSPNISVEHGVVTSSNCTVNNRDMFMCSISDFPSNQCRIIHPTPNIHAQDTQKDSERVLKKNLPYRPGGNLTSSLAKPDIFEKQIPEQPMYSSYPGEVTHQRDNTIDPELLASVLGQKIPLQPQMDSVHYTDGVHRNDAQVSHYRNINPQDRDTQTHMLEAPLQNSVGNAGYDHHRQNSPTVTEAMLFQHQPRPHHYRP